MRILVVEDDKALLTVISDYIDELGHEVLSAEGVDAAVEQIWQQNGDIDLIIADVCMPEASGVTLTEIVKGQYPDMHIILMSGKEHDYKMADVIEKGVMYYFQKPFELDELGKMLSKVQMIRMRRNTLRHG